MRIAHNLFIDHFLGKNKKMPLFRETEGFLFSRSQRIGLHQLGVKLFLTK
jgi:hypothetical protein